MSVYAAPVRRLPRVLTPADGEPLPSYVARMAHVYRVPTNDMLAALGLSPTPTGRPKLVGYGTLLPRAQRAAMHAATGLPAERIAGMLLARYDGLAADLSQLNHEYPASFVAVARRQWLLFRISRLCPDCLAERSGAWKLSWKLPWSFACTRHACLLLERCPSCGHQHGHGTGDSCLPPLTGSVPDPLACAGRPAPPPSAPATRRKRRGPSPGPCGQALAGLPTCDLTGSGTAILAAQTALDQVLDSHTGRVAGDSVPALEYFAEARSMYSLWLHHGHVDDIAPAPEPVTAALAGFYAQRDAVRASGDGGLRRGDGSDDDRELRSDPSTHRKHIVMYRKTLTNVAVTAALAPTVTGLLANTNNHELCEQLKPLARRIYDRHGGRLSLRDYYGVSSRVEAALLAGMPRRRSALWVTSEVDRLMAADRPRPDQVARFVAPLLWRDSWAEHFAHLIVTRADWPARRFLSMQLVKLATQCSWDAAAAALGYCDMRPGVAIGYVNRASRDKTIDALRRAAEAVLQQVRGPGWTQDIARVDYSARRAALAHLHRIDHAAWQNILAQAGARDSNKRRYCAAIWLWSELTGGYPTDAPGWVGTPERALEMYRQFHRDALPQLREPLLAHGRTLLVRAGDSQPGRTELTLVP